MNGSDRTLDSGLARFVDCHVRSLVAWEILVFFEGHRGAVLDEGALAKRLRRRPSDITSGVDALCRGGVLQCSGGLIRFGADPETVRDVSRFASASSRAVSRRAILGRVLPRLDAAARLQAEPACD